MKIDVFSRLLEANKIVIGLSGGADSIALTHILFSRFPKEKLIAAHLNHSIRGDEGDSDEQAVRNFCEIHNIKLVVHKENVPNKAKQLHLGLEECGRQLRYELFLSLCENERDVIVTAHNADDNAETVLLNLLRGTGLHGICGIPQIRGKILRPILDMKRYEIESYCHENKLDYVTDSTNLKNDYTRNKVRNLVFPLLKEINSSAINNINSSSEILTGAMEYINEEVLRILEKIKLPSGLNINLLKMESEYIISEVIIKYLGEKNCHSLERMHLLKICDAIKNSGRLTIPGKIQITVKQDILTVIQIEKEPLTRVLLNCNGETNFGAKIIRIKRENNENQAKINNLLFIKALDCDKIKKVLTVGPRVDGEKFTAAGRNVRKTVKKLFNEYRIPADLRDNMAIIRDGENIVFIEGIGVSEAYKITSETKHMFSIQIIQEEM